MRILLANPRCYCAGVDRAVQIVDLCLDRFEEPVYVRKEIVHNQYVVNRLRDRGAIFVDELDAVPDGALTVFSAHGVSPAVHAAGKARGLRVIDATCPLVTKVHLEVLRFVREGYHIVLVGHDGHEEVEGTMGHAPEHITLIEDVEQARGKPLPACDKLMALTQTTLSVDDTQAVFDALRERFPHLELPPSDDICYATTNRQQAVKTMCEQGMDLLVVVGSTNSSNANRLVETARARGAKGVLCDGPEQLEAIDFKEINAVGVTGAASTPDELVQRFVQALIHLGGTVETVTVAEESVVFQLPVVLRKLDEAAGGPSATRN